MSDDRCPKCGAVAEAPQTYQRGHPSAPETITRLNWKCGSWWEEIQGFTQSVVCRAAELEQELARRRSNTLLGLRGIGAPEDDPDPEFRLGVLAGGLKAEVERLRGVLNDLPAHLAQSFAACLPATMFMYDSKNDVQMDSVIPEESFRIQIKSAIEDWVPDPAASAASEPKEPTS